MSRRSLLTWRRHEACWWQFVFPAGRICRDPKWGEPSRYRSHESVVQRAVTNAARKAGLAKRVSSHPPLVYHSPAGRRCRHPDRAGTVGAQGREPDDGVHARAQPRLAWRAESGGPGRSSVAGLRTGLRWHACEGAGLRRAPLRRRAVRHVGFGVLGFARATGFL